MSPRPAATQSRPQEIDAGDQADRCLGVTVVLVEHDMKLVMKISSRIHVLDQGRTLAQGTAAQVRANPDVGEDLSRSARMMLRRRERDVELRPASRCCAMFRSMSPRARWWRWSAATAPARPRCCARFPGVQPIGSGAISFDGKPIDALSRTPACAPASCKVPEGPAGVSPAFRSRTICGSVPGRASDSRDRRDLEQGLRHRFPRWPRSARSRPARCPGDSSRCWRSGRALMARPKLLLLDEPSMGLAPMLAEQILANVAALKTQGLTVLLVEQNAHAALAIADRAYVLETGRVTVSGESAMLRNDARVREAYLGL
jgi:branched-chain amino acid transport system ATP-binding protein